jgi:hypothetical protein
MFVTLENAKKKAVLLSKPNSVPKVLEHLASNITASLTRAAVLPTFT